MQGAVCRRSTICCGAANALTRCGTAASSTSRRNHAAAADTGCLRRRDADCSSRRIPLGQGRRCVSQLLEPTCHRRSGPAIRQPLPASGPAPSSAIRARHRTRLGPGIASRSTCAGLMVQRRRSNRNTSFCMSATLGRTRDLSICRGAERTATR